MTLQHGLPEVLTAIATDFMDGKLNSTPGYYGLWRFRAAFRCNNHGQADEVVAFLNELVSRRLPGWSVVDGDYVTFAKRPPGLVLAEVPAGHFGTSEQSALFYIDGERDVVATIEREPNTPAAIENRTNAIAHRRSEYFEAGDHMAQEVLDHLMSIARSGISHPLLTREQLSDICAILPLERIDKEEAQLVLDDADLSMLGAVLAVLGYTSLLKI